MAKGYLIFQIGEVSDPQMYKSYRAPAGRLLNGFGGRAAAECKCRTFSCPTVGSGNTEAQSTVGRNLEAALLALVEYPSSEHARAYYTCDHYQKILRLRLNASDCSALLVEGEDNPPGG